jgi:hypothetical protein
VSTLEFALGFHKTVAEYPAGKVPHVVRQNDMVTYSVQPALDLGDALNPRNA